VTGSGAANSCSWRRPNERAAPSGWAKNGPQTVAGGPFFQPYFWAHILPQQIPKNEHHFAAKRTSAPSEGSVRKKQSYKELHFVAS